MNFSWQASPLYQRMEVLAAEHDQAMKAEDRAGERVLVCIQVDGDSPHGSMWQERRQAYKDAVAAREAVFAAWQAAREAFEASPAGQARDRHIARFRADPIARASASVQEPA